MASVKQERYSTSKLFPNGLGWIVVQCKPISGSGAGNIIIYAIDKSKGDIFRVSEKETQEY